MTQQQMLRRRPKTIGSLVIGLNFWLPVHAASAQETNVPHVSEWVPYVVTQPQKMSQLLDVLQLPKDPANALQFLQDNNRPLDLNQLQSGQTIRLPKNWFRQEPVPLKVTRIRCTGKAEPTTANQQSLYPGMSLGEGDIINVPGGCQVSLSLRDGSQLQLPSSSVVQIDTLRDQADQRLPQVKLKLLQGKISLNVFKKRSPESTFEVETPRATTGVRGTEFRVSHDPDSDTSTVEVIEGEVQTHAQGSTDSQAIRANQGAVIDGQGHIGIETLPEAPRLAPQGSDFAWQNVLANLQYRRQDLQAINETSAWGPLQTTPGAGITSAEATAHDTRIVQAAAISPSGLMGAWATYAVCAAAQSATLCPVRFQMDEDGEQAARLNLRDLNADSEAPWMSTRTRNPHTREVLALLPPGQYAWQLQRVASPQNNASEHTTAQGQFTLIGAATATSR